MTTFVSYKHLPEPLRAALLELEDFIGGLDGQEADDGTIDSEDAVVAFNTVVAALPPSQASGEVVEILQRVEWSGREYDVGGVLVDVCPWCRGHSPAHDQNCKLSASISRSQAQQPAAVLGTFAAEEADEILGALAQLRNVGAADSEIAVTARRASELIRTLLPVAVPRSLSYSGQREEIARAIDAGTLAWHRATEIFHSTTHRRSEGLGEGEQPLLVRSQQEFITDAILALPATPAGAGEQPNEKWLTGALAGLPDRLDRLYVADQQGERFILSTDSARNIVGIVCEWLLNRLPAAPSPAQEKPVVADKQTEVK